MSKRTGGGKRGGSGGRVAAGSGSGGGGARRDGQADVNRVRREVDGRTVQLVRAYNASVTKLWAACTTADRIGRWFLPVTGDLRVGGRYQVEGNAGGVIERCEPPHEFAATWEYGDELSRIEVRVSAVAGGAGGGAQLLLAHAAPKDDEKWEEFGPGALGVGWDLALLGLAQYLRTGSSVGPAWMATDEGKAYIRACSAAWGEASVAAGAHPVWAKAAADRTAAAYTGE